MLTWTTVAANGIIRLGEVDGRQAPQPREAWIAIGAVDFESGFIERTGTAVKTRIGIARICQTRVEVRVVQHC